MLDEVDAACRAAASCSTIDLDLQQAAEAALRATCCRASRARSGAVVALDVAQRRRARAWSRSPTFDPNDFAGGIDAATWKALTADEWKPLQNRAIQDQYPPGSTLQGDRRRGRAPGGRDQPAPTRLLPGLFRFGNRTYRCWKRGGPRLGRLHSALAQSCDVYFYTRRACELGIDRLADFARRFGLGAPTGIGLPHEAAGLIPSDRVEGAALRRALVPGRDDLRRRSARATTSTTPLQLAVGLRRDRERRRGREAAARAARRVDRDGRLVEESAAESCAPTCRSTPEHLGAVRAALEGVVQEPGGTGRARACRACASAGKTGTVAGGAASSTPKGLDEDEIPIELPRPRLVRRLRAGRGARDRGRGVRRARAARRRRARRARRAEGAGALLREDGAHRAAAPRRPRRPPVAPPPRRRARRCAAQRWSARGVD